MTVSKNELIEKAKKIKLLLLDVDGVMTDGRLIYATDGVEIKNFDVNDGLGIFLIKKSGLKCVILTARESKAVLKRAKELDIDKVYHNFHYKIQAYDDIKKTFKVQDEEICFMGDDLIDIPILKRVGFSAAPVNAVGSVREIVDFVSEKKGGRGAVRELCEFVLKTQGTWDEVTSVYYE